tara:strand:- start:273 stop:491 length:219 start_codon:yes stop_codon:yes gene_type:complete
MEVSKSNLLAVPIVSAVAACASAVVTVEAASKKPTELPKHERRSSKEVLMALASRVRKALALPDGVEPAFCD